MNIGLIGPGEIGAVIVKKLRDAGYPVKMANSKGPDSLRKLAAETGAKPVSVEEVVQDKNALAFDDIKVHVGLKLFALWSSAMFFYIYGDYFELYQPEKLQEMISGRMPFGAVSQGILLGMAAVMVIPSLMPFLSLALPNGVNRWVNIVLGAACTA